MTENRHYRSPARFYDEDDCAPSNESAGSTMSEIVARRLSRRAALKGLMAGAAVSALGLGFVGRAREAQAAIGLTFTPIDHGYTESHVLAEGYEAQVLIRWGDKVLPDAPEFDPLGQSAAAQAKQFGYNNDFVHFSPLPEGSGASDRGLLWVNHEYTIPHLMLPGFADPKAAAEGSTAESVAIEQAAHGGSVVEIVKTGDGWSVVGDSPYNRRIHLGTPMRISGPAAGHARLKTGGDPSGTKVLGMINNCAGGWTPWGTILSGEENFHQYFGGDPKGVPDENYFKRYGIKGEPSYPWGKFDARFDVTKEPNEPSRFGWLVEIDPYDPASIPVKRTALGHFKHEGAAIILNGDGRIVVYSGDDERFEYVYRFLSEDRFDPARGRANGDLLDRGVLAVAKFGDDGSVEWLPLVHGEGPLTAENGFADQADILIETRRAADLMGATKMDRPEDIEVNPKTGKVYVVLTKNDKRKAEDLNRANPRAENKWGQIVEIVPPGGDHAAPKARWEMFLLAGDPAENGGHYGGDVGNSGWFANPDNIAFDSDGNIWIATDGFTDFGVHDGIWAAATEGEGRAVTRHFFGCPRGAEMCGPMFTPDSATLFLAVQHPADEEGSRFDQPSTRWPDFDAKLPPRPAVVAITKKGGGRIGS